MTTEKSPKPKLSARIKTKVLAAVAEQAKVHTQIEMLKQHLATLSTQAHHADGALSVLAEFYTEGSGRALSEALSGAWAAEADAARARARQSALNPEDPS